MTKQEFNDFINRPIQKLGLPEELIRILRFYKISDIVVLISYTRKDYLLTPRFCSKDVDLIENKLALLGLDFCPDGYTSQEWIEELENKLVIDINQIPEKYREAYAIGVGVIAEKKIKEQGLIARRIEETANYKNQHNQKNIRYDEFYISRQINIPDDNVILDEIRNDNIYAIMDLEKWVIDKYQDELIRIVLENEGLSIENKANLLSYITNVRIGKDVTL